MRGPSGGDAVGWSPTRLRLLVGGVSVFGVGLAAAAVWGVVQVVDGDPAQSSTSAGEPVVTAAVSDEEQQSVTLALPDELAMDQGADLVLPAPTTTGPGGVPSGFPRTPEGAVAQLAALDQAVLEGMSLPEAIATGRQWIAVGGPASEEWSVVRGLEALLTSAQQPAHGSSLQLDLAAAMAKVETDPTDVEVVACVDFVLSLVGVATEQIAAADCQRMTWKNGRWLIAAGPEEPSPASVWPGTPESLAAGWRWVVSPDEAHHH